MIIIRRQKFLINSNTFFLDSSIETLAERLKKNFSNRPLLNKGNLRNNIEKLYENCIKILTDLIGFKTISGDDNSNLINYCEEYLQKLGATSFKTFDEEKKRVNLFATFKAKKTNGIKPIILFEKSFNKSSFVEKRSSYTNIQKFNYSNFYNEYENFFSSIFTQSFSSIT